MVLGRIEKWMTETGLTIAPEKSEMVALIGKKKCRPLNIYIAGEKIIEKNNVKYLGVILDKSLKFGAHLEYVAAKAAKTITALSRIMPRVGGQEWEDLGNKKEGYCRTQQKVLYFMPPPYGQNAST